MGKRDAGALYAAIRKYGADSVGREVLALSDDWETLCQLEIAAIASHGTLAPGGYNMTLGGEGVIGPRDDRTRDAISRGQKKRFERPEQRAMMKEVSARGVQARRKKLLEDPNREEAQSERRRSKLMFPDGITSDDISRLTKEGMCKPEVKEKLSRCAKQRSASPDWRQRISESRKGKGPKHLTDEWKQSISDARKREWSDPETRERRLSAIAKARQAKKEMNVNN